MRAPMRSLVMVLLRLHPAAFREARGVEVEAFVEAERERAARRGALALVLFWTRTTLDLVRSAVRLRVSPSGPASVVQPGRRAWDAPARDLRHAARTLASTPVLSAVVVLTLGLSVGMTTAIFSVVDAVLLQPLDYRAPDRLVHVTADVEGEDMRALFSGGDLQEIRRTVDAFEAAAGAGFIRQNLTGAGLPRQVGVGWGSGDLFEVLGVEAALGRTFVPSDGPGTVVLTHTLWRDQFGSDPDVLGRSVQLDGHAHTVVGVLPEGFRLHLPSFPSGDVALWKNPDTFWQNGDIWNAQGSSLGLLRVVGRLAPAGTLQQARQQLDALEADLRRRFAEYETAGLTLGAVPLQNDLVADVRRTLLLLLAAVGVVLLIACANVMGLLLVRARQRRRTLAVRRALGASRGRLFGLLLGESAILAALGGGVGVVLAVGGTRLLEWLGPALPRAEAVAVDARILAFGLAISVGVTFLVGLVPALGGSRADPADELRGLRSVAEGSGGLLRNGLVVTQLAFSLVLLVASGLLTSSLVRSVDPGFDPEGLLTFAVSLPGSRYEWPDETGRFLIRFEERIADLPGLRTE